MKLNKTEINLSNGTSFVIVHDLPMKGAVGSFDAALDNWLARTKEYTADSFVNYVKCKDKSVIFLTFEEYEKRILKTENNE